MIGVLLLPLATNVASEQLPDNWKWVGWPLAVLLAAAIVVAEVVDRQPKQDADNAQLDQAARLLAAAVERLWRPEARARELNRDPIRLRWATTGRPVTLPQPDHFATPAAQSGDLAEAVVDTLLALPCRQIVVLGAPGAGKSVLALVLTLNLLERYAVDQTLPVPLLLNVSSWNPKTDYLWDWMAWRAAEDGLVPADDTGRETLLSLIKLGRVLPVLDGLDEIPAAELHQSAIEAIDIATSDGHPLVLTCRAEEYERAVTTGGRALSGAAVVEIEPVDLDAAAAYLARSGPTAGERWQPVVTHLRTRPDAPAAQVLSSPLMVWLARKVYTGPANNPKKLIDPVLFTDATQIEEHLLNEYLPTVYNPLPPETRADALKPYDKDQAHRWLSFLARYIRDSGTQDLAWWRLHAARPARRPPIFVAFATGVGLVILDMYNRGGLLDPDTSLFVGMVIAVTALVASLNQHAKLMARHRPTGEQAHASAPRIAMLLVRRLAAGTIVGLAYMAGAELGDAVLDTGLARLTYTTWLLADLVVGLGLGLFAGLVSALAVWPTWARGRDRTDGRSRRWARERVVTALGTGLLMALITTLAYSGLEPFNRILVYSLVTGVAVSLISAVAYGPVATLLGPPGEPRRIYRLVRDKVRHSRRRRLLSLAYGPAIGAEIGLLLSFVLVAFNPDSIVDFQLGGPARALPVLFGIGLAAGLAAGAFLGTARTLFRAAESVEATSPETVFRSDRTVSIIAAALTAVTFSVVLSIRELNAAFAGHPPAISDIVGHAATGTAGAVAFVFVRFAWARFVLTRWRLALGGHLPWRLMAFLRDAHKRGVLRQVGGVYQFRHARLQDHLSVDRQRSADLPAVPQPSP